MSRRRENLAENELLTSRVVALTRSAELANPRVIGLVFSEKLKEPLLDVFEGFFVALYFFVVSAKMADVALWHIRKRRAVQHATTKTVTDNAHGLVCQLVQGGGNIGGKNRIRKHLISE